MTTYHEFAFYFPVYEKDLLYSGSRGEKRILDPWIP